MSDSPPPPGYLPHPGIEPVALLSLALAGGFFTTSATWELPYVKQTLFQGNKVGNLDIQRETRAHVHRGKVVEDTVKGAARPQEKPNLLILDF